MTHDYSVELYSEEFGSEEFRYESPDEQIAGARRLADDARSCFKKDGIRREVRIIIGPYEEDCDESED
jgi:hypothetical protein